MLRTLIMMLALAVPLWGIGAPAVITIPRPETERDARNQYPFVLLTQALQRAGGNYVLRQSGVRMQQGRALVQLEKGRSRRRGLLHDLGRARNGFAADPYPD